MLCARHHRVLITSHVLPSGVVCFINNCGYSIFIVFFVLFFPKGDFTSAMKTLETAIAVIKESRVANDDRCRVLLTSLRDCLHGIQDKASSSRY